MISGPSLAVNVGGYVVALVITASVLPAQLGIGRRASKSSARQLGAS